MLNCRDVTERASDFIDARLPIRIRLEMRLHLLMCRFCREYLRQMALVVRTLRQLPSEQPSEVLKGELLQAFSAERP
jgi:hypothetical protein